MVGDKKKFFEQPIECYKMLSWEYHIIQHTQITTEKLFLCYHKLGWDME